MQTCLPSMSMEVHLKIMALNELDMLCMRLALKGRVRDTFDSVL